MDNFLLLDGGDWNPSAPPASGHGHAESSVTHSSIFLLAKVARMPKARSLAEAASMLARSLPEGEVNASRVEVGDRSERMSSIRGRVGDLDGVRVR